MLRETEVKSFQNLLVKELNEKYKEEASIVTREIVKSGDMHYHAISILPNNKENRVLPNIYVESFLKEYLSGKALQDIINEISELYENAQKRVGELEDKICISETYIYENVKPRFINIERNQEYMKDLVFYRLSWTNEFCIMFNCIVNVTDKGIEHFAITEDLFNALSLDIDLLYEKSLLNIMNTHRVSSLETMLTDMLYNMSESENQSFLFDEINKIDFSSSDVPFPIYVLTNESTVYGSEVLLDNESLKKLENYIGSFYIFPSSIHEVMALAKKDADLNFSVQELKSIVCRANETVVSREEVLGESIYLYEDGIIKEIFVE